MKQLNIGIIGVGVVGSSVAKILEENKDLITARTGCELKVKIGVVKDLNKKRDINIPLSDDIDSVLNDKDIDIVIELMGGVDGAYKVAIQTLKNNKALVTANKAMLAYHRYELANLDSSVGFEASVCGGIPIIKILKDGLSANKILAIRGILNGTSNYILSEMTTKGSDFKEALKEAQNLGYAEADPTLDINGHDAAHKLLILASLAYGINAKPSDILIEGIESINSDDIAFAKEFGLVIKLLGIAKKKSNEIELRVHPTMINAEKMLAKVDGVMNAISVVGDCIGENVYYGAGAGGDATASAVISDLVEIARGKSHNMLGFKTHQNLKITAKENIKSRYYLRILAVDKPGVLEKIAKTFSENNISIKTFLQKEGDNNLAKLLLTTHTTTEKAIQKAINDLKNLNSVKEKPVLIRIENE